MLTRQPKLIPAELLGATELRDIVRQERSFACILEKCQVHVFLLEEHNLEETLLFENSSLQNSYKIHVSVIDFCLSYSDGSDICPKRKSLII